MTLLDQFHAAVRAQMAEYFMIKALPADRYSHMQWPRMLPMMRFSVDRYRVEEFGQLMVMRTRAMGGLMQLVTASFMPFLGKSVPYLLIDMMQMQKKRTVFIEYYDCTAAGVSAPELDAIRKAYSDVPDYAEKPAWYIAERMPCSLIKGVTDGSEKRLCEMVMTSIEAYARLCRTAPVDPNNLKKLVEFRSRMLTAGNPSSATMEKVLGPDGAKAFFENVVMPMN